MFASLVMGAYLTLASTAGSAAVGFGSVDLAPNASATRPSLANLIEGFLQRNSPTMRFTLGRRTASTSRRVYRDLTAAGLLQQIDAPETSCETGPAYILTEKGRATAGARGWKVTRDALIIPIGDFRYIPSSETVTEVPAAFTWAKGAWAVTFSHRYLANGDARYLLSLGPPQDWYTADYSHPSIEMSVNENPKKMTLVLQNWKGRWSVERFPY